MRSGSILLPGGSSGQDARTTPGLKMNEVYSSFHVVEPHSQGTAVLCPYGKCGLFTGRCCKLRFTGEIANV
jgi:hypothetical protein